MIATTEASPSKAGAAAAVESEPRASLTVREIVEREPELLGATIAWFDGAPKPPARFTKQVRAWEHRNGRGILVEARRSQGKHKWDDDSVTLRESESAVLVVNMTFGGKTAEAQGLRFRIEAMPAPGAIMLIAPLGDGREVRHYWQDEAAAYEWGRRGGYSLKQQATFRHAGPRGAEYVIIGADGTAGPWEPQS